MLKKDPIRRQRMISLRKQGLSYQDIGNIFGISRQRVHQITSGYDDINSSLNHIGNRPNTRCNYLKHLRNLTCQRYNNTCQRCGAKYRLILHHLDGDDRNNDPNNLIVVCRSCHQNLHYLGIKAAPTTNQKGIR